MRLSSPLSDVGDSGEEGFCIERTGGRVGDRCIGSQGFLHWLVPLGESVFTSSHLLEIHGPEHVSDNA
jgi:hypothetical protein